MKILLAEILMKNCLLEDRVIIIGAFVLTLLGPLLRVQEHKKVKFSGN